MTQFLFLNQYNLNQKLPSTIINYQCYFINQREKENLLINRE